MSTAFNLNDGSMKSSAQELRVKAVQSALVLINTAVADSGGYLSDAADGDLISKLADKIEAAINNVE
ncbi:MAG: hypothetical protein HRT53_16150 [Colwellia sp.]|nr:hypothetical protein [Colwellia sp.]